ncbi:MAG: glycosyltransferase, partial [Verrucomicrobiaceae bacterium]
MRILVYDPEHISHSTDVVRRGLLPEMAKRVERLVWMLPESRHEAYKDWLTGQPSIELAGFELPRTHPGRWLDAVLRRFQGGFGVDEGGNIHRIRGRLQAQAASLKAREISANWIFCPSFMNQPVPRSSISLAGMIYDVSSSLAPRTLANIDRWIKTSSVTFSISRFTRQQVLARLPQIDPARVIVTPLCPDVSEGALPNPEGIVREAVGSGSLRVLCPAALLERKGHAILLKAAQRCADQGDKIQLVFVGSGTQLLKQSDEQQPSWILNVRLAFDSFVEAGGAACAFGHVTDVELETLFCQADVVVFPSLFEGFGLPVAEAVQRGLPVIASDLPPIHEQLDLFDCHDRVSLVAPGDVEALAGALSDFAGGKAPSRQRPEDMVDGRTELVRACT